LLVRTIDHEGVNVVDGLQIEAFLSQNKASEEEREGPSATSVREPIFKLSWSEFPNASSSHWGGESVLTILGGNITEDPGVTVHWFPIILFPELPVSPRSPDGFIVHRKTICRWLTEFKSYFMSASGSIQDFLLIPRDSPHFSGAFDPIALLFLCESDGNTRSTEAYPFPPANTLSATVQPTSNLQTPGLPNKTRQLRLPNSLLNGTNAVVNAQLLKLADDAYEKLVTKSECKEEVLPLNGGLTFTNKEITKEIKLSKVRQNSDPSRQCVHLLPSQYLVSPSPSAHNRTSQSHCAISGHQRTLARNFRVIPD
jgi:syntaxin-binding protein 5